MTEDRVHETDRSLPLWRKRAALDHFVENAGIRVAGAYVKSAGGKLHVLCAVERHRKVYRKAKNDVRMVDAVVLPADLVLQTAAYRRRLSPGITRYTGQRSEDLRSVDILRCAADVREAASIDNKGICSYRRLNQRRRTARSDLGDGSKAALESRVYSDGLILNRRDAGNRLREVSVFGKSDRVRVER